MMNIRIKWLLIDEIFMNFIEKESLHLIGSISQLKENFDHKKVSFFQH